MLKKLALAGLGCLLTVSAAGAQEPLHYAVYLAKGFGGDPGVAAPALRYGFQVTAAAADLQQPLRTHQVLGVEMDQRGLVSAQLAGLGLQRAPLIVSAAEEAAEPTVGDQIGGVFKGLGIGLGTVVVAGGVAAALIIASAGDSEGSDSGSGETSFDNPGVDCTGRIDVVGPCNPLLSGSGFAESLQSGRWEQSYDSDLGTAAMGDLVPR